MTRMPKMNGNMSSNSAAGVDSVVAGVVLVETTLTMVDVKFTTSVVKFTTSDVKFTTSVVKLLRKGRQYWRHTREVFMLRYKFW